MELRYSGIPSMTGVGYLVQVRDGVGGHAKGEEVSMENIGILDVSGIGCCETRDIGFRIGIVNARMEDLEVLGQGVFG